MRVFLTGIALATLGAPAAAQTSDGTTLAEAVAAALATHPSASAARARVEAAEQVSATARAARLPGLSLRADVTRFEEPMVVAPLHSFDPRNPPRFDESLVQGQALVSYTLFDGGARSARVRATDAAARGSRSGLESAHAALVEEVAHAYLGLLAALSVRDAATARLEAVDAERARADTHFEAGTAARVEVLRAEAALQDARAAQAAAEARADLAHRRLALLMGVDPAALVPDDLADVGLRDGAPSSDGANSPTVERAERAVEAARARLAEERATRLPRVDAGAGLQDFGTLTGEHVVEWQAGLRLTWPLFTGGARSASVRRAEAELRLAESDLELARLHTRGAEDAATAAIAEADARAAALESSVARWTEVARIEALALEAGSGVQSDLLQAEAALFQARAGRARARYDAISARVTLARARGRLDIDWLNDTLEIRR